MDMLVGLGKTFAKVFTKFAGGSERPKVGRNLRLRRLDRKLRHYTQDMCVCVVCMYVCVCTCVCARV